VRLANGEDPLGQAVHGDLDLDNVDNVIRAATAMGVVEQRLIHPYEVARALLWEDDELRLAGDSERVVGTWRAVRGTLYDAILTSKQEFLAQTALKWAIEEYARNDASLV